MNNCDFTDSAKCDLEEIIDYSLMKWGKQKTSKYLSEILNKTLHLSLNPNIGILRSDIYLGLLSFPIKRHIVYYLKQEKGIIVIRVLHAHMHPKIRNFPIPKIK